MGAVSGTASVTAGGASEEPGGDAVVPSGTAGCADMAPTTDKEPTDSRLPDFRDRPKSFRPATAAWTSSDGRVRPRPSMR